MSVVCLGTSSSQKKIIRSTCLGTLLNFFILCFNTDNLKGDKAFHTHKCLNISTSLAITHIQLPEKLTY